MYNQASVGFVLTIVVIGLIINPLIKSFMAKLNEKDKNKKN